MFMADPRSEVIVKRVLDQKNVELMYPGNEDAAAYNRTLELEMEELEEIADFEKRLENLSKQITNQMVAKNYSNFFKSNASS